MTAPLKVALLYGGPSAEHEISLISAASVLTHLSKDHYQIIPIGIDKKGRCFYTPLADLKTYKKSLPVCLPHSEALPGLCIQGQFVKPVDVVFPMVHGPLLEDGALQGILEWCRVAYVGSDVLGSALAMDKYIAKQLAQDISDIQLTPYQALSIHADAKQRKQFCETIIRDFHFPVFVKPCSLGSSVGIHKVSSPEKLLGAITDAFHFDETILVEEGVVGREIELSVLENIEPHLPPLVSLPGELKVGHADSFYSYVAKYIDSHQTELCAPAQLQPKTIQVLQQAAAEIFTRLKCKGMARVDFFVNEAKDAIYFSEINTLPGFTPMSMYPKAWEASGLSYPHLLDKLIQLALARHRLKQNLVRDYQ